MRFWKKIKKPQDILPFPVSASHAEYSLILSQHDDNAKPTSTLLELSFEAIQKAAKVDLSHLSARLNTPPYYPDIWPGEHYKLLSAFCSTLKPKRVIEVGTATGLSSLALKEGLSKESDLITFDLFSWKEDPATVLREKDFQDQSLVQQVADLSDIETFDFYRPLIEEAELIFIDATHDGKLEKELFRLFNSVAFKKRPYFLFDDIRVWTMLKMWREITLPKLDITSFGHWSGTGIVEGKMLF